MKTEGSLSMPEQPLLPENRADWSWAHWEVFRLEQYLAHLVHRGSRPRKRRKVERQLRVATAALKLSQP